MKNMDICVCNIYKRKFRIINISINTEDKLCLYSYIYCLDLGCLRKCNTGSEILRECAALLLFRYKLLLRVYNKV